MYFSAERERTEWIAVEELLKTVRGTGGFDHTGKH